VAAACLAATAPADALTLAEWGIGGIVSIGTMGPPGIAALLAKLKQERTRAILSRFLSPPRDGEARRLVEAAFVAGVSGIGVSRLKRALHCSTGTLARRCAALGLPPPHRLLQWMRIMLAAEMTEAGVYASRRVAYACGYRSEAALQRALIQVLGLNAGKLREAGAVQAVRRAFAAMGPAGSDAGA
jgi:AraC-like DNA-binding protein